MGVSENMVLYPQFQWIIIIFPVSYPLSRGLPHFSRSNPYFAWSKHDVSPCFIVNLSQSPISPKSFQGFPSGSGSQGQVDMEAGSCGLTNSTGPQSSWPATSWHRLTTESAVWFNKEWLLRKDTTDTSQVKWTCLVFFFSIIQETMIDCDRSWDEHSRCVWR